VEACSPDDQVSESRGEIDRSVDGPNGQMDQVDVNDVALPALPELREETAQRFLELASKAGQNESFDEAEWTETVHEELEKNPKHSMQSLLSLSRSNGQSLLHVAFAKNNLQLVQYLVRIGVPWNIVDDECKSAPEVTEWKEGWEWLKEEAVRYELIMSTLAQRGTRNDDGVNPDNAAYLSQPLKFVDKHADGKQDSVLLDAHNQGVMMGWELPIMKAHVESFMKDRDASETVVLNIGFGLGLVDQEFQTYPLLQHHIIEAHPDVLKKMDEDGWMSNPNVHVHAGRWQDVLPTLSGPFDVIYFDTFSEDYWDMSELHEELPNLMREGGVYSFFNGLGGTNPFFHDVFCELAKVELEDLGFHVEYRPMQVDSEHVWNGIKRRYWNLPVYNLPIAKFQGL